MQDDCSTSGCGDPTLECGTQTTIPSIQKAGALTAMSAMNMPHGLSPLSLPLGSMIACFSDPFLVAMLFKPPVDATKVSATTSRPQKPKADTGAQRGGGGSEHRALASAIAS